SFTLCPGLRNSAFPRMVHPVASLARFNLISGVLPMASRMEASNFIWMSKSFPPSFWGSRSENPEPTDRKARHLLLGSGSQLRSVRNDGEGHHATPSFFCRSVEEVVYRNTSRSPGRAILNAA